jgi:GTPase SAR1 family protein
MNIDPSNKRLFPNFQPFSPVDPRFFVNRNEEKDLAWRALFRDKVNLLVTGPFGIGKSSFLRKIEHNIKEQPDLRVFPVQLNMISYAFHEHSFDKFLNDLIKQLCASIVTIIFKMDYSEFLEDLYKTPDLGQQLDKRKKTLFRISRFIKSEGYDTSYTSQRQAGVNSILIGKATDSNNISFQVGNITNFEFLMFIDELKQILKDENYDTILFLCDEANKLSEEVNIEIIQKYFEIFASKNIQFIFVTVPDADNKIPEISDAFGCQIRIGNFQSSDSVEELVHLVLDDFRQKGGESILIEKECFDEIHEICNGQPWWIQRLCRRIFESAIEENRSKIDKKFVINCGLKVFKEMALEKNEENKRLRLNKKVMKNSGA